MLSVNFTFPCGLRVKVGKLFAEILQLLLSPFLAQGTLQNSGVKGHTLCLSTPDIGRRLINCDGPQHCPPVRGGHTLSPVALAW